MDPPWRSVTREAGFRYLCRWGHCSVEGPPCKNKAYGKRTEKEQENGKTKKNKQKIGRFFRARKLINWSIGLSVLSFLCSILAVLRMEPIEFNAVGLLATIIAVPVAVLAILQAINYFWFKDKIKKSLYDLSAELREEVEKSRKEMQIAVKSYYLMKSSITHIVEHYDGHIRGALDGLLEDAKSSTHIARADLLNELYTYVKLAGENDKFIDTKRKNDYIRTIRKIDDDRVIEICNFLESCLDVSQKKVPEKK